MKKIAIVTGATGGLGKEFTKILCDEGLDEIWAIARSNQKLQQLQDVFGKKVIPFSNDILKQEGIDSISERLLKEKPEVRYLINNAGIGKMGEYNEFTIEEVEQFVSLNCKAVVMLCMSVIPYMGKGSHILNLSSQASFQPIPYLNLYAATKAFVTSYSRSLNVELRKYGIIVTAVCPGWVDTDLLEKEWNGRAIRFPGIAKAEPVARKAIRDAQKGKDLSVYGSYVKSLQLISKLIPHKVGMYLWMKSIEKYRQ
jgi:Short-chain dehydrogenases of various substrate specificities